MKQPLFYTLLLLLTTLFGQAQSSSPIATEDHDLLKLEQSLQLYPVKPQAQVLVVGTFHFNEAVLAEANQQSLHRLIKKLADFDATKVVLELEPSQTPVINAEFTAFLKDSFPIAKRYNEVYQLGFRLAKQHEHKQVYLFDNQTEFIGSLQAFSEGDDPFSFQKFSAYAKRMDDGFYNRYEKELITTFDSNQKFLGGLPIYERIALMNSVKAQQSNAQRMHMYELRVGIQKNWVGADWVGRFYQRNLRMAANVLKMMNDGDRILIIVGDNHKWVLDEVFTKIPDIELVSSWDFLKATE